MSNFRLELFVFFFVIFISGIVIVFTSGQKAEHKSQQSEKKPTVIHYYDDGCFVDDGKNEYQLKRLTTKDIEDHIK